MPTSSNCVAYRDQAGDYVCDRCGTRWDADDEKPPCRGQGKHVMVSMSTPNNDSTYMKTLFDNSDTDKWESVVSGREALKRIREDLEK